MSPINSGAADLSAAEPSRKPASEQAQAIIEVPYCDVKNVRSFAIAGSAAPNFSPGDQIYLRSGVNGAYRTVLTVEAVANGSVIIVLEPSRAERIALERYGSTAGVNLVDK